MGLWGACWQALGPGSTDPPGGCCLLPGKHKRGLSCESVCVCMSECVHVCVCIVFALVLLCVSVSVYCLYVYICVLCTVCVSVCFCVCVCVVWVYLENTAHPLEAVLLRGIRPLLCHHHNPLIMEHRHREHRYPGTQQNTGITTTMADQIGRAHV